ncbi:MAG TPA: hypothetical protein VGD43_03110, partial [Micromonospora sp.]
MKGEPAPAPNPVPSTAASGWPDLADTVALAATDPGPARSRVTALAGTLAVEAVPAFLDHACGCFLAAGH